MTSSEQLSALPMPSRRTAIKALAAGAAATVLIESSAGAAVTDKLYDQGGGFVNVRAYGAVGDGVADDTVAIRNAVAAAVVPAGRNAVYFPAGTYLVTGSIEIDYGLSLVGANPGSSTIKMSPSVLSDMFVGKPSGGFPVYLNFSSLCLDGGLSYAAGLKTSLPVSSGTAKVTGTYNSGTFYQPITLAPGGSVAVSFGDVLRLSGQPCMQSVNGADVQPAAANLALYTGWWAPATTLSGTNTVQVYKTGNLISGNVGRLSVDNCRLLNAKRNCIDFGAGGGEHRITRSTIGASQGSGIFGRGFGDGNLSDCWMVETGCDNFYAQNGFDFVISGSLLEGAGGANISADGGTLIVSDCDLWGGRHGNIWAQNIGVARLSGLKVRAPGTGSNPLATIVGSTSFPTVPGLSSIDVSYFQSTPPAPTGGVLTNIFFADATEAGASGVNYAVGSIVRIRNGSRTNLSNIDYAASGITFSTASIIDAGTTTISRGCRGLSDRG
jgi:Pectate lyase superfamily protein